MFMNQVTADILGKQYKYVSRLFFFHYCIKKTCFLLFKFISAFVLNRDCESGAVTK